MSENECKLVEPEDVAFTMVWTNCPEGITHPWVYKPASTTDWIGGLPDAMCTGGIESPRVYVTDGNGNRDWLTGTTKPDDEDADDEPYDDSKDHDKCDECGGSGWYTGLNERTPCETCFGSGWV